MPPKTNTNSSRGRPQGSQSFSNQKGGACFSTRAAFKTLIDKKAGGDATGLITDYLTSNHARKNFSSKQFDRLFDKPRVEKLLSGIRIICDNTPYYDKVMYLSV